LKIKYKKNGYIAEATKEIADILIKKGVVELVSEEKKEAPKATPKPITKAGKK